ncbi:hypothetical protein B296_00034966 [Ensete ventricosum]|uniref:Uncharacterized protein n=1 Tax=Ensete ventricosum TaxID=4639 RepID=A0A426X2K2_ENSVE|nr:hypothetical protein B296_00034966 [Ensete ventricosum]
MRGTVACVGAAVAVARGGQGHPGLARKGTTPTEVPPTGMVPASRSLASIDSAQGGAAFGYSARPQGRRLWA